MNTWETWEIQQIALGCTGGFWWLLLAEFAETLADHQQIFVCQFHPLGFSSPKFNEYLARNAPFIVWRKSAHLDQTEVQQLVKVPNFRIRASFACLYEQIEGINLGHKRAREKMKFIRILPYGNPKKDRTLVSLWFLTVFFHNLCSEWPFQEPKLEVPTIYKAYVRAM